MSVIRRLRALSGSPRRSQAVRLQRRPGCEALEGRALMAGDVRSLDGSGNNVANPTWGADGTDLLRLSPAQYGDGISTPAGADRPSARVVSNVLSDHPSEDVKNSRDLSNFVYAWGQFIDHDLDLTNTATPRSPFNVAVPKGDPEFDPNGTGTQAIPLSRSKFDPSTGTGTNNPRQQINDISAYLDGSMVYGSDATRAAALRTMSGGKLKTSAGNMLPLNTAGLANANDTHQTPDDQLFLAGDVRANENIELTSIQTLFVREHNRLADAIAKANPGMSDEAIYQAARRTVIAEIQSITYNEFLPTLLGPNAMRPTRGYNPNVNAGISTEFSTAAFRFGHSMLVDDVEFMDESGGETREAIALKDAFFNPNLIKQTGVDPLLKYLATDNAEEIDLKVVDSLRNFLFGAPGQGGLDLAALNIQRGREHGLADYNTTRAAFGLSKVKSFAEISSDPTVQAQLKSLYGSVDKIDLWVGGLAEDHVPGGSLGATFTRIVADQFMRTRDGDRFFFEFTMKGKELADVEHTTLADVIKRNSGVKNIQDDVFVFKTAVAGRVFADGNANGRAEATERGVGGREIQLLDATGALIASTKTDPNGAYHFDGMGVGAFQVREVAPAGVALTTPAARPVSITRGMLVDHQDFGEKAAGRTPPPPPSKPSAPRPPQQRQGGMTNGVDTVGLPGSTGAHSTTNRPFRNRPGSRFLR